MRERVLQMGKAELRRIRKILKISCRETFLAGKLVLPSAHLQRNACPIPANCVQREGSKAIVVSSQALVADGSICAINHQKHSVILKEGAIIATYSYLRGEGHKSIRVSLGVGLRRR